jgi:hypothetical protein
LADRGTERYMARESALGLGEHDQLYMLCGILYVPLLFDSNLTGQAIKQAGRGPDRRPLMISRRGRDYIRAVSFQSLVENYSAIQPETYMALKNELINKYSHSQPGSLAPSDCALLETIVLGVMPHFVSVNPDPLNRKSPKDEDIIDMIVKHERIPLDKYRRRVLEGANISGSDEAIKLLRSLQEKTAIPKNGPISAAELDDYLREAAKSSMLKEEFQQNQELQKLKEANQKKQDIYAVMLYLSERKRFELNRFGIMKNDDSNYVVYVKTGEFALSDKVGKIYHFPDCKVGVRVNSYQIGRPLVVNEYKHPFLMDNREMQTICIVGNCGENRTTSGNLIRTLEVGLSTILHGYLLDRIIHPHHLLERSFSDYEISEKDYRLRSGRLVVTNQVGDTRRRDW